MGTRIRAGPTRWVLDTKGRRFQWRRLFVVTPTLYWILILCNQNNANAKTKQHNTHKNWLYKHKLLPTQKPSGPNMQCSPTPPDLHPSA